VEHVVALLCNPSAGGGRAARVLPEVEVALRELGVCFHTTLTRSVEQRHARELPVSADRSFAVYAEGAPSAGRRR